MQTWITDKDFSKSAKNLDRQRLCANMYESIHILASLLDLNDQLVTPKRNVSNHPASKIWNGNEECLYVYIACHIEEWTYSRGYKCPTNNKNMGIIYRSGFWERLVGSYSKNWITDEMIQTHRSVLIQKKPEHYRPLWPDCPDDLEMRYDWRYK